MSTRIIVSISSDIGLALARHWLNQGHRIFGTYRTRSDALNEVEKQGARLIHCDIREPDSVLKAAERLLGESDSWDALVVAPGAQEPVGPFLDVDFDEWDRSISVNFTGQLRMLHALLSGRNQQSLALGPLVLFFAGGGANNATVNYSAYTISKIALTKMCELLDAEIADTRFAILGPGWVQTKIHDATLAAGELAGANYERTLEKLGSDECVPMQAVLDCCDWFLDAPRDVVGGRNISLVYDRWGGPELNALLQEDSNLYKLRRSGNDRLIRSAPISKAKYQSDGRD